MIEGLINTRDGMKEFLQSLDKSETVFVDTETTGFHQWRGDRLCSIQIGQHDKVAFFPFRMNPPKDDMFLVPYDNMTHKEINHLNEFIRDVAGLNAFNYKFDGNMLRADGIPLHENMSDTYVACSLVLAGKEWDSSKKKGQSLKLKSIAKHVLGKNIGASDLLEDWFASNGMAKEEDRSYDKVPFEVIVPYGLDDIRLLMEVNTWAESKVKELGLESVYKLEMEALRAIADMEFAGSFVDREYIIRKKDENEKKLIELKKQFRFNPSSPHEVIAALKEVGVNLKVSEDQENSREKHSGKFTYDLYGESFKDATDYEGISTDEDALEKADHPLARSIIEFRKCRKPIEFFEQILEYTDKYGYCHPSFKQFSSGKTPGRTSCTKPNLQQMPRDDTDMGVRDAFVPPKGMKMVFIDFSQLHLRIAANIANEKGMIASFLAGYDPHAYTASEIYGVPIDSVTKTQRKTGKDSNFTVLYGGGVSKLAEVMGSSQAEAAKVHAMLQVKFPGFAELSAKLSNEANKNGFVRSPGGRIRFLDEPRKAFNTVILGVEADVTKRALANLHRESRLLGGRAANFVHDEVQIYVPEDMSDEKIIELAQVAEDHSGPVPLIVDVAIANPDWGHKKDIKKLKTKTIIDMSPTVVKEETVTDKKKWVKDEKGPLYTAVEPASFSLKDLDTEGAIMRITTKDGLTFYIAGNDAVKKHYDNGKRKIYTVQEFAEFISIVNMGSNK